MSSTRAQLRNDDPNDTSGLPLSICEEAKLVEDAHTEPDKRELRASIIEGISKAYTLTSEAMESFGRTIEESVNALTESSKLLQALTNDLSG